MALKSTLRKAAKPAASAKIASTAKPARKTKPATRIAKSAVKAVKAPAKTRRTPVKPVNPTQKITFTYFAPQAGSVLVAGDFTGWATSPISLVKKQGGTWSTTVALKPGKYQYRLLVDGQWQNDPGCPDMEANEFGSANCILSVAA
jgi:1,4-alpha-glucan branching enzyme